jgi:outer membrane protein assembly factor BamB
VADLFQTPAPDGLGASTCTEMRRDRRHTGSSPTLANYAGEAPWRHVTGRRVLTTPVIGPDGAVFIGSADGLFDAFEPDGRLRWTFETRGVIDSAALVTGDRVTFG